MNKVAFYLSRMAERNFSPEMVLLDTGLTPDSVSSGNFKPSLGIYRQIIHNMIELTGDPHIGIAMGFEFTVSDLGVLGYASLSSGTLSQSRNVISKYYLLNEYIIEPRNFVANGEWMAVLNETYPLGKYISFAVEEFVARMITLAASITNRDFPILEMNVTYEEPKNSQIYREKFDCPCYFNQPENIIKLDGDRLNDPILLANEEVFELCEKQCRDLASELEVGDSYANKIKQILLRMPGHFPVMYELSELLKVSPRTMRRRLVEENITYQAILDDTRKDLAMQYLGNTNLTPKEIGYLLGYSNVSNFRRAFKHWTGKKLSDYRP